MQIAKASQQQPTMLCMPMLVEKCVAVTARPAAAMAPKWRASMSATSRDGLCTAEAARQVEGDECRQPSSAWLAGRRPRSWPRRGMPPWPAAADCRWRSLSWRGLLFSGRQLGQAGRPTQGHARSAALRTRGLHAGRHHRPHQHHQRDAAARVHVCRRKCEEALGEEPLHANGSWAHSQASRQ